MNKNTSDQIYAIENGTEETPFARYMYHSEAINVDGRIYPVLSVIPLQDKNGTPETAEEKLIYLVKGKKG